MLFEITSLIMMILAVAKNEAITFSVLCERSRKTEIYKNR